MRAPRRPVRTTAQQVRRLAILLGGCIVMLVGGALLVLPGPGLLIILAGLAALATEFVWARKILKRLKSESGRLPGFLRRWRCWRRQRGGRVDRS